MSREIEIQNMFLISRNHSFFKREFTNLYQTIECFFAEEIFLLFSLKREWYLASKYFGKIVILNGVSSVGKTTLSNYLCELGFNKISKDEVWCNLVLNFLSKKHPQILIAQEFLLESDLWKIIYGFKVNKVKYLLCQKEIIADLESIIPSIVREEFYSADKIKARISKQNDILWDKAKKYIYSGENVIIDAVIEDNWQMGSMSYSFGYYPMSVILLYSSLEANLNQCYSRNNICLQKDSCDYRPPFLIIKQYFSFYTLIFQTVDNIKSLEIVNLSKVKAIVEKSKLKTNFLLEQIYDSTMPASLEKKIKQTSLHAEVLHNTFNILDVDSETALVLPQCKFSHLVKLENLEVIDGDYSANARDVISALLDAIGGVTPIDADLLA